MTRRRALEGLGILGTAALTGCSSVDLTAADGAGLADMRIAQPLSPVTLDPLTIKGVFSKQVASQIFQGLYTYRTDMEIVPELAESEPDVSDDRTTYTVTITDEARFQNGEPVTATDVQYTFEAPLRKEPEGEWDRPAPSMWAAEMIESVETVDERTVRFSLAYPYPAFEHALARQLIVPRSAREKDPVAFARDPVGSGPFEVDLFKPGKYALLTLWEGYWDSPKPRVEEVKFVPVHSGLARTMSLRTNQNHIVEPVEPNFWQVTKNFPHARVETAAESFWYHFLGFNCRAGPASDPRVREAIDYCVDVDKMVEAMIAPAGERQYSPLPRRMTEQWELPLDDWREIPHGQDIARAKELFAAAGVEHWAPTILVPGTKSSGDELREKMAHAFVEGLGKATFLQAGVKKVQWPLFQEMVVSGSGYDMFLGDWVGFPDPDSFTYPLFHEDNEGETNGTFYQNQTVMDQLRRARRTSERQRRKRLYESAITTVLQDRVHLPLYLLKNSFGLKDNLTGFEPHPMTALNPRLVGPENSIGFT